MKKSILLLLCLIAALPMTAQKKTFTAACLNVDGLPPTVKAAGVVDVKLNPEGPQETGTLQMSKLVAQKGWDFFGVSENFNYNTQLMSEIGSYYSCGTYRGSIPSSVTNVVPYLNGSKWFETDGLNLLWRSNISVSDEAWYLWNKRNGITSNGSDQLIAKGFRFYTVRVGAGLDVDVYILHMDAETDPADNEAREIQMTQLVDMILASDNHRPIIIMGDTNCRYTRDRIKELMFDRINADPRFEMHDPWIDFPRKGVMPSVGDPSIMVPGHFDGTNHDAFQTGEVVDKIFYINNTDARGVTLTAKSYLQDTEFTWPDGSEISDHYPIVIEFEIENAGETLTGGEYYLRNVATGKFLQIGGDWDTQAILSTTGRGITLKGGDAEGSFELSSNLNGNNRLSVQSGTYLMYTDAGDSEERAQIVWNFTKNDDGTYIVTCNHGGENLAMTAKDGIVASSAINENDANQQWEVISREQLRNNLLLASETNPIDATFLMKGYRFGRNDGNENSAWVQWKPSGIRVNAKLTLEDNGKGENYSMYKLYNTSSGNTNCYISQTITGLPNGKYIVSCDFAQGNNSGVVTANGTTIPTNGYTRNNDWGRASVETVGQAFATGNYRISLAIEVTDGSIELKVNKENTSSATAIFVDNFQLTYFGPTGEDLAALNRVKTAIEDAQAKADDMGLTSYNNRSVVDAYENRLITGDGTKEVHNTYIALAKAAIKQTSLPADMRYAILNNSFEMGDLSEWNVTNATTPRVEMSETVPDGQYEFLADGGAISHTPEVTMPSGIYELKAMLTPGAVLTVGEETSRQAIGADGELTEVSMKFVLQNGVVTVGARCDGPFKADNFTLTRIGDQQNAASYELVMLAMKDATERVNAMGSPYNEGWDLSSYQAMIDNLSIDGDGTKEFNEIYGLLREKVYSQTNTDGVSYTNAIINPSFEFGNTLGWDATFAGDTGVKENSNGTYTMSGCDGDYLFNTWDNGRGTVLSQTIPGLPAGHYRLRATVAADQGSYVYLEANGQKEAIAIERAKENGQVVSFDFDVAENTDEVTISIRGGNSDGSYSFMGGNWYKVDKFELTRHGDQKVCFFYDRLQTAIDRTNQIVYTLPEKYRNQWDPSDYRDLYQKHIDSGHASDPMEGSNGLAEIEELYSRLRALVFSQTESGADMSGAITNQSFELGDMTSWNLNMNPSIEIKVTDGNQDDVYKTEGTDGTYLINSYLNGKSAPLYQTLKGMPAGFYRLTAKVASDEGNRFYLAVNDTPGEMLTTTGSGKFDIASVEFEVKEDNTDVLLGLYPSVDGNFDPDLTPLNQGPWFKADDFSLTLLGRNLDVEWSMENDSYGTIILPFEADVPDGLEIYSVTSSTPTDVKSEMYYYHILTLDKKDRIAANTPYLVKKVTPVAKKIGRAASADESGVYTFSGVTTHTADSYTDGMLTGSMVETPATGVHYHLGTKEGNIGFLVHGDSEEHPAVAPYHAYLSGVKDENIVLSLYFEAPQYPVDWAMEGAEYGTIILPFEAEIPDGLEVYTIDALSEKDFYIPEGETEEVEYQIANLVKADKIEANIPYLVKRSGTPETVAEDNESSNYTFKGVATNTETSYTLGLLTGTFLNAEMSRGDYLLGQDGKDAGFVRLESVGETVTPHHAYIAGDGTSEKAPILLLAEPENGGTTTGIRDIITDLNSLVDVYTIGGVRLRTGIKVSEALKELTAGFYILRSGNKSVKVMKR